MKSHRTIFLSILIISLLLHISLNHSSASDKVLCISSKNGLEYTDRDARLIAAAFGRYVGFQRESVRTLLSGESSKDKILTEIDSWLAREDSSNKLIVLYLAGHGIVLGGEYYFVPELRKGFLDGSVPDCRELISRSELVSSLNRIPSRKVFLIIDSCHGGALFRSDPYSGGKENANKLVRGLSVKPSMYSGTTHEEVPRLNFAVLAACKKNQSAQEDPRLKNGVLTYYLINVLKQRAKHKEDFDVESLCGEIVRRTRLDGWEQEAVATGGNYFCVTLQPDAVHFVPTF